MVTNPTPGPLSGDSVDLERFPVWLNRDSHPVYWFNISAMMKDLIERLPEAPDFPCEGKTAYFVVAYEEDGAQQAINQMMAPLNHMGFKIPPYACYFYNPNMADKSENQWQSKGMRHLRHRLR